MRLGCALLGALLVTACGSDGSGDGPGGAGGSGAADASADGSGAAGGSAGQAGGAATGGSGASGGAAGQGGGAGAPSDGGDAGPARPDNVDVLIVMDNSNSMAEEQATFSQQLIRLLRGLLTGDADSDGSVESVPFTSLQVGVVTTDMGTGGPAVPTCVNPMRGEDAKLRTLGNTSISGCGTTYPLYSPVNTASDFQVAADQVACVARAGISGCGIEQPLEAGLKAITPAGSSVNFAFGDSGHGSGANAGFLRADSLLIVIAISDENDCSMSDIQLFDSNVYSGDPNLRCFANPNALHPVARYVSGLLALRPDPSRLFFAAVTGTPPNLASSSYQTILDDPAMQEQIDSSQPSRLVSVCNSAQGVVFPGRRMVETARGLQQAGAGTAVDSICNTSYSRIVDQILAYTANL